MAQGNRAGRRLVGVLVLFVGVIAGLLLWWFAAQRYDDAVAALAPAPIGCDTTLVFDRAGTYTLFLETKGQVGEIDGDCDTDDRAYDLGEADPPPIGLTLLDEGGDEVDLDRVDGPSYERSGASGRGLRTAEIDEPGEYVLTVDADTSDVMIRVGRDPSNGVLAMRVGAVALGVVGLVGGVLLLTLGRPGPPTGLRPADAAVRWPQVGVRPPPTAPPYSNPPTPPPYAVPPRHAPGVFPPPSPPPPPHR